MINYAHRGASEYAPENTESAFDLGIAMGANGIETDLQCTRDGVIVLFHDKTIERCTADGTGRICDHTYNDLSHMDFCARKGLQFIGTPLMRFDDFARKYGHTGLHFALEFKQRGFEEKALSLIRQYFDRSRLVLTSFDFEILSVLHALDDSFRLGWLTRDGITPENIALLKSMGGYQICPEIRLTECEHVALAHANGLDVRVWGVKNEELMRKACGLAISGMTVNFPDKLSELLGF